MKLKWILFLLMACITGGLGYYFVSSRAAEDVVQTTAPDNEKKKPIQKKFGLEYGMCEKCGATMGEAHKCFLTQYCTTCKTDVGNKGHVHGVTHFCSQCNKEVGIGHICGITHFCVLCEREVAANHHQSGFLGGRCETTFCPTCKVDVGLEHVCGETRYCPRCKLEVGDGHICEKTHYCKWCKKEVYVKAFCPECFTTLGESELNNTEVFCSVCNKTVTAVVHNCRKRNSFFCSVCLEERPLGHKH